MTSEHLVHEHVQEALNITTKTNGYRRYAIASTTSAFTSMLHGGYLFAQLVVEVFAIVHVFS